MTISPLQKARYGYQPKLPKILQNDISNVAIEYGKATQSVSDQDKIREMFPNTYGMKEISFLAAPSKAENRKHIVGVILSGGQAPGGHNVITGAFMMHSRKPERTMFSSASKAVRAVFLKMTVSSSQTNSSTNTGTQAGLTSSAPDAPSLRQSSSSRLRERLRKSMASTP